ncbi:sodium:proline symporter [uncultured Roseobacter sp.]|uniref:sodium:proline symporter n=1 Tax=uncultured Roseobacter sp. TaxID=114847 RepID=UPI0026172961|nr:sodium:proline symporter [uncultured Roseobacter sp.]
MQTAVLVILFIAVIGVSLIAAPRRATVEGFFGGQSVTGCAPGLWTLVLSQVTTWIFARSLMNAAILGYYYGIAGTLAYAAYYGSFLTGGLIVAHLRRAGAGSVQEWLGARFGRAGQGTYNVVIGLRLLSEVFANLLVVGLIFDAVSGGGGTLAIVIVATLGFAYSAWGGLSAALRTDVVQMVLFLIALLLAFGALVFSPGFSWGAVLTAPGVSGPYNGWVLLAVAALQVFSYPAHDPVMMDRGFLADPETTRRSFLHAFWISTLCIIAFGFFGIQAGLLEAAYDTELIGTWAGMFPPWVFMLLMISLLVSALSTIDSALASAARLGVEELGLAARSLTGGRGVMAVVMVLGVVLTLWGNATLFDAVAVSGTASMFLAPVLLVGLMGGRALPLWSYLVAYGAALLGAFTYFARSWPTVAAVLPEGHKYEQLLLICVLVLLTGSAAVLAGARKG